MSSHKYNTRSKTVSDNTDYVDGINRDDRKRRRKMKELEEKHEESDIETTDEEEKVEEKPKKKKKKPNNLLMFLMSGMMSPKSQKKQNIDDKDNNDDDDTDDDKDDNDDDDDDDDNDEYEEDEDDEYEKMLEKIDELEVDEDVREMIKNKYENSDDIDKAHNWINNVVKIPFGKYAKLPISLSDGTDKIVSYFQDCKKTLDDVVHGLEPVKEEILNYVAQIITSDEKCNPRVLALQGSAGTGKTSIIRKGFSKILSRPIKHISLGGNTDSSTFFGFDYTYTGSRCGIIIQSLIESGVMNPIIYLDELDKVSNTAQGQDIINFLIHITDPEQQATFRDKYIGFDVDLSKVLFVFSYNDQELISPILLDRLNIIKIKTPSVQEKKVIVRNYIINDICKNINFNMQDVEFNDEAISYMIQRFDNETGMRNIRRLLETVIMKLNTIKLTGNKIKMSYSITPEMIDTDNYVLSPLNNRKRLKIMKPVQRMLFKINASNIRKLLNQEHEDNVSYKMMFL